MNVTVYVITKERLNLEIEKCYKKRIRFSIYNEC